MKIVRPAMALLLLVLTARPCSMSFPRRIWAKKPGSASKLFAFEKNGKVGFIDPTGKVVIPPTIASSIDHVGDFSNGLVLVGELGYFNESGKRVITGAFTDFSD